MPPKRARPATLLIVGSGTHGQATVTDAPGYKCIKVKPLKKGLLAVVHGDPSFASLPFHPTWISYNATNGFMYAAGDDDKLHACALQYEKGQLKAKVVSSMDSLGGIAFIDFSRDGKHALCANYGSGVICVLPLAANGKIGPPTDSKQPRPLAGLDPKLADRQEACHPHQIRIDPTHGKWALSCDLGADCVWVYGFDAAKGALVGAVNSALHLHLPAGSGPRHLDFHPNGKVVYVLCELSGKIITCDWDAARGKLTARSGKGGSLDVMPKGKKCLRAHHSGLSHVAVGFGGHAVYCGSRTDNTIVVFSIGSQGGLALKQRVSTRGVCTRHFHVDEGRLVLVNQDTQTVVAFGLSPKDGTLLEGTPSPIVIPTPGMCPQNFAELPL